MVEILKGVWMKIVLFFTIDKNFVSPRVKSICLGGKLSSAKNGKIKKLQSQNCKTLNETFEMLLGLLIHPVGTPSRSYYFI